MGRLPASGLFLILLALPACAVRSHRDRALGEPAGSEAWQGVATIAALPPDCWTADVDLEHVAWFRGVINELLRRRGWAAVPAVDVNRELNRLRFTTGGELAQLAPADAARRFGCDAMLYWSILSSSGTITLEFQLVKSDGTLLWASGERTPRPPFKAHPESKDGLCGQMAMAIAETLRDFPGKP